MTVAPEQQRAIARTTAAQTALDEAQIDPRLIMAAKAIQLMAGQDDKGNPKISADMALAAAMYQAGTGQLLGRDFYVNEKIGRMEGYRGVSRDAVDRGVGEVKIEYRPITAAEADEHEIMAGDTAVTCEVYQLRAWRLCQQMGQAYAPIVGVGVVRKMEKYDKKTTQRWDDNTRRYVPLPETGWKFRTLEGGNTWRKIAGNRAYKEALRHVPGGLASAAEVLEEATVNGMTNQPPEAARLSMEQAIEWAKQNAPDSGPDWGNAEDAEFTHEEAKPAPSDALPADRYEGGKAERAGGNGKTTQATKHEPPAQRPWSAPDTIAMIRAKAEYNTKRDVGVQATDGKLGALIGLMDSQPWNTDDRHGFLHSVFGNASTRQLTDAQRAALVQWANPMKTGPEKEAPWAWDANAQQEYAAVVKINRSFLTDEELDGTDTDPVTAGDYVEEPPLF